jgi:hypothetical protein
VVQAPRTTALANCLASEDLGNSEYVQPHLANPWLSTLVSDVSTQEQLAPLGSIDQRFDASLRPAAAVITRGHDWEAGTFDQGGPSSRSFSYVRKSRPLMIS